MTTSLLLTNGYIHSVSEPYANALHADNNVVAWLGSDEAGEKLVAATVSGPVDTRDIAGALVTPAFIDGFSATPIQTGDSRVALSASEAYDHGVFYAPWGTDLSSADGVYVAAAQLGQLADVVAAVKPPTQLLIESRESDHLEHILAVLAEQKDASLMRSRHRIIANHMMRSDHIAQLVSVHASITVTPQLIHGTPSFTAPVASLIAAGVHVATGTGEWAGSMWDLVTALIEHEDPQQRVSTRAAFNTVSRDGVRVWPSRIAQANMSAGQVAVGSPANLNVWHAVQLGVQVPDVKSAHWSTDKRAGSALLPILASTEETPRLQFTVRDGQVM